MCFEFETKKALTIINYLFKSKKCKINSIDELKISLIKAVAEPMHKPVIPFSDNGVKMILSFTKFFLDFLVIPENLIWVVYTFTYNITFLSFLAIKFIH